MTLAADHDIPIPHMERMREYYLTLGYDNPYRWAHHVDVPFTPLAQPLAALRVALISTAASYQPGCGTGT
jgi:D-proline reductase (dithiol) PrdB